MIENEYFDLMTPGESLKEWLEEIGVSVYRFCKVTGISNSVASRIISGDRNISLHEIREILKGQPGVLVQNTNGLRQSDAGKKSW